jgi:hypothetical protein
MLARWRDCEERGGTLVRTISNYECVKMYKLAP